MRNRLLIAALSAALVLVVAIPLAIGASGERTKALTTVMTGKKEVGPDGKKNAGDLNGLGTFSAVVDSGQLCFGITVRDIDAPVAAHIHRGGPSTAGPVVLPLTHPAAGDPGASSDCVPISESLAGRILKRPTRFYVNVHTGPFPGGAVRGQLEAKKR